MIRGYRTIVEHDFDIGIRVLFVVIIAALCAGTLAWMLLASGPGP